jgi:hypothetical protein
MIEYLLPIILVSWHKRPNRPSVKNKMIFYVKSIESIDSFINLSELQKAFGFSLVSMGNLPICKFLARPCYFIEGDVKGTFMGLLFANNQINHPRILVDYLFPD